MKKRIYAAPTIQKNDLSGPLKESITTVKFGKEEYNVFTPQEYKKLKDQLKKMNTEIIRLSQKVIELQRSVKNNDSRMRNIEKDNKHGNNGFY